MYNNHIMYKCNTCDRSFKKNAYYNIHIKTHVTQQEYLNTFAKTNFDNIEYINNIPKVVFVCWFGGYAITRPIMSDNRYNAFKSLVSNIGIPIILITDTNYICFVKQNYPIHKSFDYLSGVHKSDYMRCYLLHHYGGGYHDIKCRTDGWGNIWNDNNWLFEDDLWIYGRMEENNESIGYPPGMYEIQKEYNKLVTMGWIICKPYTPYTSELLCLIDDKLNCHYDQLTKYPGILSGGYYSDKPFDMAPPDSYPIRWLEILGELYHPLMLRFTKNIKFGLPDAQKSKRYK